MGSGCTVATESSAAGTRCERLNPAAPSIVLNCLRFIRLLEQFGAVSVSFPLMQRAQAFASRDRTAFGLKSEYMPVLALYFDANRVHRPSRKRRDSALPKVQG